MPDSRRHRGRHPEDGTLFAPTVVPRLRDAVADLSFLMGRGYAEKSAVKLVGDRYSLGERQRLAVLRGSCSDASLGLRRSREVPVEALRGRELLVDGYNLLITVEAALSDGIIFVGRDGCYRDLASVHGTYRRVEETLPAITAIGRELAGLGSGRVTWFLDAPVSNSGRLRGLVLEEARRQGWEFDVILANNPDRELVGDERVVVSSDSWVLDRAEKWANLARRVVDRCAPGITSIDLGRENADDDRGE
jgi:hypothetical protein